MSKRDWLVAGGILAGLLVLLIIAGALDDTERDASSPASGPTVILTQTSSTPTPEPTPTVETTYSDVLVWRFCSGVIAGDLTDDEVNLVYGMSLDGMSKDREYSVPIVQMTKAYVDSWPNQNPNEIQEIGDLCWKWRQADLDRWEESE